MVTTQLINEINSLPAEAQRQIADFTEFLRQKYQPSQAATPPDINNEPFVGMWSDRKDFADSSQSVRAARKAEWGDN